MLKSIIVEDQITSQRLLKTIVEDYCPQLDLVGVASSVQEGRQLIQSLTPDLIFLDIDLDGQTGFDLLDSIDFNSIKIIFTTAYDNYAINAFKYQAVDYILKPYSPKEIINGVNKVIEKQFDERIFEKLHQLIKERTAEIPNQELEVVTTSGVQFLDINKIIRVEASGSYSTIHIDENQAVLVSKLIKVIEGQLPTDQFYRVHKSHLLNLRYIKEYIREDGGYAKLTNADLIPIARRRKDDFLKKLLSFKVR